MKQPILTAAKLILPVFVGCTLVGCTGKTMNVLNNEQLKGHVRSVESRYYPIAGQPPFMQSDSLENYNRYDFDEKGALTDAWCETRGRNRTLLSSWECANGKAVREVCRDKDNGEVVYLTMLEYNDEGRLVEERKAVGKDTTYSLYEYDADGKKTAVKELDKYGGKLWSQALKYDKNGLAVETYIESEDMHRGRAQTIKYDSFDNNGNWVKRTLFYENKPISVDLRSIQYH